MPETMLTVRHGAARHPCPRCGWDKSMTSMMPKERDHGERVSECPMCEYFAAPRGSIK
jgi:hypothetical protein